MKDLSKISKAFKEITEETSKPKLPFFVRLKMVFEIPTLDRNFLLDKVEDYFDIPKEKREYKSLFYKSPEIWKYEDIEKALSPESIRKKWAKEIKKVYPVQWFFREFLLSFDNPIFEFFFLKKTRIEDFYYKLKAYLFPWNKRSIRAARPFHYSDMDGLFEKINISLLLDFYYEDYLKTKELIDWKAFEGQAKFEKELIEWVRVVEEDIPSMERKTNKAMDEGKHSLSLKIEDEIENKKTLLIVWMAQNRGYFWT